MKITRGVCFCTYGFASGMDSGIAEYRNSESGYPDIPLFRYPK